MLGNSWFKKERPLLGLTGAGGGVGSNLVGGGSAIEPDGHTASGGIIHEFTAPDSNVYRCHIFLSPGTFTVSELSGTYPAHCEYLVVGGGGGGGCQHAGGGGAGGVRSNVSGPAQDPATNFPVATNAGPTSNGQYPITVGKGGAGSSGSGPPGANPALDRAARGLSTWLTVSPTVTIEGGQGGGGGNYSPSPTAGGIQQGVSGDSQYGTKGSSGGSGSNESNNLTPAPPDPGQDYSNQGGRGRYGGGGGGGRGAGGDQAPSSSPYNSGPGSGARGGDGIAVFIAGPPVGSPIGYPSSKPGPGPSNSDPSPEPMTKGGWFGGGGAGGSYQSSPGHPQNPGGGASGGLGGGGLGGRGGSGPMSPTGEGRGSTPGQGGGAPGFMGTGGGGGGGGNAAMVGGWGGPGICVIRYQIGQMKTASASGGNISFYNNKTIHAFVQSGTFTTDAGFNKTVEYVVIGGGGGGGGANSQNLAGGGGGAGAYKTNSTPISTPTATGMAVQVGEGGIGGCSGGPTGNVAPGNPQAFDGAAGQDSSVAFPTGTITAPGGGDGGRSGADATTGYGTAGGPGGSGAGAGGLNPPSGTVAGGTGSGDPFPGTIGATPANGWGHDGAGYTNTTNWNAGSGGGGAGSAGVIASASPPTANGTGGPGGFGIQLPTTFRDPAQEFGAPGPTSGPSCPVPGGFDTSGKYWVCGGGGGYGGAFDGPPASPKFGRGGGPGAPVGRQLSMDATGWAGAGGSQGNPRPSSDGQSTSGRGEAGTGAGGGGGGGQPWQYTARGGSGGTGLVLIAYPT